MSTNDNGTPRFRRSDQKLLLALASGYSIRKAAAYAKVSPKTVDRRLHDPHFQCALTSLRGQMTERAIRRLSSSLTAASVTLRKLLKADSETVRLGASRAYVGGSAAR
jgi:hypothetical protein